MEPAHVEGELAVDEDPEIVVATELEHLTLDIAEPEVNLGGEEKVLVVGVDRRVLWPGAEPLGRLERESWSGPGLSEEQRIEWLLGRVVAKEAVRLYLKLRYGIVLYSADIDILLDENGNLLPQGAWSNNVPHVPVLSLSHSYGSAIAVVGDSDGAA